MFLSRFAMPDRRLKRGKSTTVSAATWVARELCTTGVCRPGSSTQAVERIEFLATRGLVFRKGSVQEDTHGCGCSEEGGEE
mgnify:CR=1 FL=1